jgi:hypothetical protein
MIAIDVIACIFTADFISGAVHWLEDAYGDVDCPILGVYITRPNIIHHYDPRHFVKHNDWVGRLRTVAIIAILLIAIGALFKILCWQYALTLFIGLNANEVHKWSHCNSKENGWLVTALQKTGLIQSPAHHAMHHKGRRNSHYCVVTNYLNPLLDGINFWRKLELVIRVLTGVRKRTDPTLRYSLRVRR